MFVNLLSKRIAFVLTFAFVGVLPRMAGAQTPAQPPLISVSGSAEIKVAPDVVHLRVGVETRHANLDEAKSQNDDRIAKALAFLKASEVKEGDVQTDFVSIEPLYGNDLSRPRPAIYIVRKSIEIKLTKIEKFEAILSGLLNNGINNVQGIEFRTSELRKHRDAARAMAIRAAREKADALAAELGVKRGKVHSINASDWGGLGSSAYWGGRFGGAMMQNVSQSAGDAIPVADETVSIGQISVSASVNVSFLIE